MTASKQYAIELRRALKREAERLQSSRPEFAGLIYNAELHAFRKPPKGWSKHPVRIVSGFLTNAQFRRMTNSQVVVTVADWFSPYRPSESIMTRPLTQTSQAAIQKLFDQQGLKIKVRPTDTLSKLKKAIQAGQRPDDQDKPTSGTVEVTEDFVTANGHPLRVDKSRTHPSIRVTVDGKRQYIRCDALHALLVQRG